MGDGHHHPHGPSSVATDRRALILALVLLVGFMAFEVGAAVVSNSLVLLADAGHMLVDVGAIAGSLIAIRLAARPETGSHTYGLKHAEILAAAGDAIALLVVSALVTFEADPPAGAPVLGRRLGPHRRGDGGRRGERGSHADAG